ncbi:DUF1499 domain-containing protein [uncultured Tateyamaria sp.]|uniref:DUF1499 domain-containing protein n=1 Tax=uncultured Tateyamaria sp. TaxID=455651 RepID=UPI0026124D8D|nr:DUF1499 domain-containing protein [uncultured Tateyamaria sp.]
MKVRLVMYLIGTVVLLAIAAAAYVRLAPTDVARWHQPVTATQDKDLKGGAIRVVMSDSAALVTADRAMRALPRTRVLAGSVDSGRITYVTRSQLWGFPDYTTIEHADGMLRLFGRLRFGSSDLGVNAARLTHVLAAIEG